MSVSELWHRRILVMLTNLIKGENPSLSLDTVVIPSGLDIRRQNAYTDASSPDGEFSGAVLWPEYSLSSCA
jgi:hypothetical protein